ncbi:MAG: 3'-5' exonuclease [Francisella endosymbiont of Hyalomma asiaticum]
MKQNAFNRFLDKKNEDKNDNQVQIITIHASKGLEF